MVWADVGTILDIFHPYGPLNTSGHLQSLFSLPCVVYSAVNFHNPSNLPRTIGRKPGSKSKGMGKNRVKVVTRSRRREDEDKDEQPKEREQPDQDQDRQRDEEEGRSAATKNIPLEDQEATPNNGTSLQVILKNEKDKIEWKCNHEVL